VAWDVFSSGTVPWAPGTVLGFGASSSPPISSLVGAFALAPVLGVGAGEVPREW
jgi:hypothetical protein